MSKKFLMGFIALMFILVSVLVACTTTPTTPTTPEGPTTPALPEKDKIVIGQAVSLSGPNAIIHASGGMPPQRIWIDDVNAKGGIYVEEYGKKLPVELLVYDDKSDHNTMTRLIEKLITEDKVDLMFPPCSTSYLFAAAPIFDKYGYILLGNEGGAKSLEPLSEEFPYLFTTLNYSTFYQMPLMAEQLKDWGMKTAAITHNDDLFGIEYRDATIEAFEAAGIDIKVLKSHEIGAKDLSPILKEAKAADVDVFGSLSYPNESIMVVAQAMELEYNPKVFFAMVGPYALWYRDIFGGENINGLIGGGAWSRKQSPGAQELYDKIIADFGPEGIDQWGNLYYWAGYQFLEQAIEKAGTLDQKIIRDIMATETFDTALGPTWFDDKKRLARECHPGEWGQWQNGEWEVILPRDKSTAEIVFPKPKWGDPIP
jgi:branched-chain amino acid transport system substrate-binding protein